MSEATEQPAPAPAADRAPRAPAESRHQLDRKQAQTPLSIAACMRAVREKTGKTFFKQVREIATLSFGPGRLTADDYYKYRLYDNELYTPEEKRRFLSDRRFHQVTEDTCHPAWRAVTSDKIVADQLLKSFGVRVPEMVAAYLPGFRECGTPVFRDAAGLAGFLRETEDYPLFAKQINGVQSWGAWSLREYDASADAVRLLGDGSIGVDELAREIASVKDAEYMIQKTVEIRPEVRAVTGPGLSTLRIALILGEDGPEIIQWVWKVTAGANPADNFWRSGNMLAALDFETGAVTRVIRGSGPFMEEVEEHPDTGARLLGFELPDWEASKELAKHCACFCPKLGFQSYDIALTADGPLVIEMNSGSAFSLFQLAYQKGFLTDRWVQFYEGWEHQDQPPS